MRKKLDVKIYFLADAFNLETVVTRQSHIPLK